LPVGDANRRGGWPAMISARGAPAPKARPGSCRFVRVGADSCRIVPKRPRACRRNPTAAMALRIPPFTWPVVPSTGRGRRPAAPAARKPAGPSPASGPVREPAGPLPVPGLLWRGRSSYFIVKERGRWRGPSGRGPQRAGLALCAQATSGAWSASRLARPRRTGSPFTLICRMSLFARASV